MLVPQCGYKHYVPTIRNKSKQAMAPIPELAKRLLLTMLVALIVIELGIRYHLGLPLTAVAMIVAGFAVNFLVPRE